ncbi:MAG: galactose mutarotase [Cyclobacteriaceae bacterium]
MEESIFGEHEGQSVKLYHLSNDNGMSLKITNYGATITSIKVPVNGETKEVACGFDTLEGYFSEDYKANSPYFGCTVGRYCSQIKDAKFSLNGVDYKLASNAGDNNLHGGAKGFDKKMWSAEISESGLQIQMTLKSDDLEEGFPGNVQAKVNFALTNDNEIAISYEAVTDKETPLAMTNHTYFNLTSFSENVENHVAQVNTNKRLALDETGAATGEILVLDGKDDDLRGGKKIGEVHEAMGDGFEHFYVFDNSGTELINTASISSESSGLKLEVFSTEPCMLLYTGKYTSDDLKRESGDQFGKYRGFCCETHRYPNGPNIAGSPGSITEPGKPFTSKTIFKFSS